MFPPQVRHNLIYGRGNTANDDRIGNKFVVGVLFFVGQLLLTIILGGMMLVAKGSEQHPAATGLYKYSLFIMGIAIYYLWRQIFVCAEYTDWDIDNFPTAICPWMKVRKQFRSMNLVSVEEGKGRFNYRPPVFCP